MDDEVLSQPREASARITLLTSERIALRVFFIAIDQGVCQLNVPMPGEYSNVCV